MRKNKSDFDCNWEVKPGLGPKLFKALISGRKLPREFEKRDEEIYVRFNGFRMTRDQCVLTLDGTAVMECKLPYEWAQDVAAGGQLDIVSKRCDLLGVNRIKIEP